MVAQESGESVASWRANAEARVERIIRCGDDYGEIRYDEFDRYVVLAGAGRTMHRARVERDGSWGTTICGLYREFAMSYTIDEAPRLPWVCCTLCVRRLDRADEERARHSDGQDSAS